MTKRVQRTSRLRWVPIADMRVNPLAQREIRRARVDALAANFDPDAIGHPVVNLRDGHWYIIDGQNRIEALKAIGWGDQQVQCEAYEGLTVAEEAAEFRRRNDTVAVGAFDKFRIGIVAGFDEECDIDRIVRAQGLVLSRDKVPGAIACVTALRTVYRRGGPRVLARTLRIIRDAYGDAGLTAKVIEGIALLCQRYADELADDKAVLKLGAAHGGVAGLTNKAEVLHRQTGSTKPHCIAAAAVEIINTGRGGAKLPGWWKAAA